MSEAFSMAEATRATDPRKKQVPGATPFVPNIPDTAPEYLVVDQPYYDGRYFDVGSVVKTDAPIIKELGSPGRCLKPVNHQGAWPPKAFVEAELKAKKRAREEWIRDMRQGM